MGTTKDRAASGGGGGKGKGDDKKIELTVVVTTAEAKVKARPDDTLLSVVQQALKKSESSQPIENWELRDEAGNVLDLTRTVASYGLADGALLSLTQKAGIAG